jgi:isoquinoline 1-oxidoreductase beta subunit
MGKWTRRAFITTGTLVGGGLVLGIAIRRGHKAPEVAHLVTQGDEALLTVWVKLAPDNRITVIVPHSEMGQGVHTALPMMLADEMDADWKLVDMMQAPAHEEYANYALGKGFLFGDADIPAFLVGTVDGAMLGLAKAIDLQITGGSTAIRTTGVHGMRVAGAAAREMLLEAASQAWNVSPGDLRTERSYIYHDASARSAPYGEFATAAASITPPAKPRLKTAGEFTIMGHSQPRIDTPSKVDGTATYGIDAQFPGIRYASILQSPVFGGTVKRVNAAIAEDMPGNVRVVRLEHAVATVADGYWQAQQALKNLEVEFDDGGNDTVGSETIFEQFARDMDLAVREGDEITDLVKGDVVRAIAEADRVVEAEYRVPYLAHAPMEPLNATVWMHDGICEVWTGSQNPLGVRGNVADAVGMADENVIVHPVQLGGGFGRRSQDDYAIQAAQIALATGEPIKLIWSREEDVRQDRYRPAVLSRFRAGLDAAGHPTAWVNQFVDKHDPAEATHIPYGIENQFIHYVDSPTHVPFGVWRSVDHSQHGFFTESFVDEVAHAAGKDPFEFRRDLLEHMPRHLKVLETAAAAAKWGWQLPARWGRGIALQQSFGTIVAQIVEAEVTEAGKVKVHRVVCAVDCGFAINPDGLIQQMESGIIYGLTAALYGEITIENGAVRESNFHDYEMLRIDECPKIETHIVNSGEPLGGAGEPGTPAIAPALANAIFDATGARVRALPIKNYDFNFRIEETDEVG